jgi:hypothetical protein
LLFAGALIIVRSPAMTARGKSWMALVLAGGLCVALPESRAQEPFTIPAEPAGISDADRFFHRYAHAARLLRQNRPHEASVTMDLLWKSLGSSPWLEIALLKFAELNETRNTQQALESYELLRKRLENAPYWQGSAEKAQLFRAALEAARGRGIDRVRILRIREALQNYYARYLQYPESLARLAMLGYVEISDIHRANGQLIRYTPSGQQFRPGISYQRYELETIPAEPFTVSSPRLEGTSRISDSPPKYAALIRVPGRADARRVVEDQMVDGYLLAAITAGGAIVCTPERVLVLLVPD